MQRKVNLWPGIRASTVAEMLKEDDSNDPVKDAITRR
jgi:hypothetical protein